MSVFVSACNPSVKPVPIESIVIPIKPRPSVITAPELDVMVMETDSNPDGYVYAVNEADYTTIGVWTVKVEKYILESNALLDYYESNIKRMNKK